MITLTSIYYKSGLAANVLTAYLSVTFPNGTVVDYDSADAEFLGDGSGRYQVTFDERLHGTGLLTYQWSSLSPNTYTPSPQGGSLQAKPLPVASTFTVTPTSGAVPEGLVATFTDQDGVVLATARVSATGPTPVKLPEGVVYWDVTGRSEGRGSFTYAGTSFTLAVTTAVAAWVTPDPIYVRGVVEGLMEGEYKDVEITIYPANQPLGSILGFPDKERSGDFPTVLTKYRMWARAFGPDGAWSVEIPHNCTAVLGKATNPPLIPIDGVIVV